MNGTLGCVFAETQNPKIDVQNIIFLKPACFSRSPNRKTCFITPRSTENVGMYLLKSRTPNRCSKHSFPQCFSSSANRNTCFIKLKSSEIVYVFSLRSRIPNRCQNIIFLKPACFSRSPNRKACFIKLKTTEILYMYLLKPIFPNRY